MNARAGRPHGRIRAWAFALFTAAAALAATAAPASALPSSFWGVMAQAEQSPAQFQRLKRGGADSIRLPIPWSAIQPAEGGPLSWTGTDAFVVKATNAGLRVLPFLYGAPVWAMPADRRYGSPLHLPVRTGAQRTGWTAFAQAAVQRYGPTGTFWSENPAVPKRPFRTWQIWNEANFEYFVAQPNPAEYGKLVKLSSTAIKGVDPGAKIVLGGLFSRPKEAGYRRKPRLAYYAAEFLDLMYRRTPGVKAKFDAVALHPYASNYKKLVPYAEEFRQVLKTHGDAGKRMLITELGWSSRKPEPNNSFAKGIGGQARELRGAFSTLLANQRKWKLDGVYWFSADDAAGVCNFCDGSGLFSEGFLPKPSWYAYVKFAGGKP